MLTGIRNVWDKLQAVLSGMSWNHGVDLEDYRAVRTMRKHYAVSQAFGATCGATTKTSRREETAIGLMQLKSKKHVAQTDARKVHTAVLVSNPGGWTDACVRSAPTGFRASRGWDTCF